MYSHYQTVVSELMNAYQENRKLTQFQNLISAHQYLHLYDTLARYVGDGESVLDWGAGNGHFSYFLTRSGYITSGYGFGEIPKVCRGLRSELYTYGRGDIADPVTIPYGGQSFDAVVSVGVLEHVRDSGGDEIESLKEIYRLLKPGGVFICYHLPNQHSWIEWTLRLTGRWSHSYRYTQHDIRSLTDAAGLHVLKIERYAILPRNIWSWASTGNLAIPPKLAQAYDRLDKLLGVLASQICQNYCFVARR